MTEREICHSYHNAKHKAQQIQILADLNGINILEIIPDRRVTGKNCRKRL